MKTQERRILVAAEQAAKVTDAYAKCLPLLEIHCHGGICMGGRTMTPAQRDEYMAPFVKRGIPSLVVRVPDGAPAIPCSECGHRAGLAPAS